MVQELLLLPACLRRLRGFDALQLIDSSAFEVPLARFSVKRLSDKSVLDGERIGHHFQEQRVVCKLAGRFRSHVRIKPDSSLLGKPASLIVVPMPCAVSAL